MKEHRAELRPLSYNKFTDWVRRIFARSAARAHVVAEPAVRLGQPLEVEWRLEGGAPEITLVTVALIGSEIAHRRISARTGISVVTERRPFLILEIDRQAPDAGAPTASGRGAAIIPARTAPSFMGRLNEIAWAIVVEAFVQTSTVLRQEFPLSVLPVSR
jgi:hypothetical protein